MAIFFKERSNWLLNKTRKYFVAILILAAIIITIDLVVFVGYLSELAKLGLLGIVIIFVILFLFKLLFNEINFKGSKMNKFIMGDDGEADVEDELKKLSNEYNIFSDIKKPNGGNIDFVVVGPTGIFALEVKNPRWYKTVKFNGENLTFDDKVWKHDPLYQAIGNATVLGEYLKKEMNDPSLFVNPVVVFARSMEISFGLNKLKNVVYVIGKTYLDKLLSKEDRPLFTDQKIFEITEKLKNFNTKIA